MRFCIKSASSVLIQSRAWRRCEAARTRASYLATSNDKSSDNNVDASPTQPSLDKGFNLLELASGIVPQGTIVKTVRQGWRFVWRRMMAELAPQDAQGNYRRPTYKFKGCIGQADYADEAGRYHLYVGNPCPWCHRCLLAVKLMGFTSDQVGVTRLLDEPTKASRGGWIFTDEQPDPLGSYDLRELYDKLDPGYKGRCTAPLLIDKRTRKIVSNESSDIVRMLDLARLGGSATTNRLRLYPEHLGASIDATNEWVYSLLNDGCYRCGFATTQQAYDQASAGVRQGLAKCEAILEKQAFLCADVFTEADLRLLPTMLRFDGAYAPLFRAGGAHLKLQSDYPNIHQWMRRCWKMPGVKESIDLEDATSSYFRQLFPLNPGGLVPSPVSASSLGLDEE
ncbi:hypothetical protein MPSEU_001010200 [Mayamaea pseudoterrestris]|nr:hypothetical protein MPSEU_001010200 [Mayamaea pseudoterrestris]